MEELENILQEHEEQKELERPQLQNVSESSANDFANDPNIMAYIDSKVREGIQKALQGNTPKANIVNPTAAEIERFNKMTYKERLNLFNSSPEAYNKLSKGAI